MKKTVPVIAVVILLCGCALLPEMPQRKPDEEQQLMMDAQKALDAKAYVDAISLFQKYTSSYPQSKYYTIALQRLGESYEGLLEMEYQRRIGDSTICKYARTKGVHIYRMEHRD